MDTTLATRRPIIHLLNPLERLGGSEMRTVGLYRELREVADVNIWTEGPPAAAFADLPVQRIDMAAGHFPRGGALVLVGAFFSVSSWIQRARPERVIIVYNTFSWHKLDALLTRFAEAGLPRVEMLYASELIRLSIEEPNTRGFAAVPPELLPLCHSIRKRVTGHGIQLSPIDLLGLDRARRAASPRPTGPFVVGRLMRDTPDKFHDGDPAFFRRLAAVGFSVRLMGATCIADRIADCPGIEVLPNGAEPAPRFIASLDAFLFRTSATWLESFGRVVFEAMAAGLPCVCHVRGGGYPDVIDHGRNGFLFGSEDEALETLLRLRADPILRERVGQAARETIQALYSPAAQRARIEFFLRPSSASTA